MSDLRVVELLIRVIMQEKYAEFLQVKRCSGKKILQDQGILVWDREIDIFKKSLGWLKL